MAVFFGFYMDEFSEIRAAIEPAVNDLGLDIVRMKWVADNARKALQVMVEPQDGSITQVEHCQEASQVMSAILDVEDIIKDEYNLEVSSPGIDRPLTRLKDFEKYKSFEAKIEIRDAILGQRRFRGHIIDIEGENINFEQRDTKEVVEIEFSNVLDAKLVLTDELIKAGVSN